MTSVYWFLGLPFDVVRLGDVRSRIFAAASSRRQLVFATPNVSFLASAYRDPSFRDDILRTDLSIADGTPIIWLGRLLGIPFTERVAGSDLIDSLNSDPGPRQLKVYFLGGEEGVAAAAVEALNRTRGGLIGVGASYPGFVSPEQMDGEDLIQEINRSDADLLAVALGAAKGHRWIEANRHRLRVPVICYLGAVVNFVAGTVNRAPPVMRRMGLEWLWRIKEEPKLFRRYARDAVYLVKAVLLEIAPQLLGRLAPHGRDPEVQTTTLADGTLSLTVHNRFGAPEVARVEAQGVFELTMRNVRHLDAAGAGWLYARHYRGTSGRATCCDVVSRTTLTTWGVCTADMLMELR